MSSTVAKIGTSPLLGNNSFSVERRRGGNSQSQLRSPAPSGDGSGTRVSANSAARQTASFVACAARVSAMSTIMSS